MLRLFEAPFNYIKTMNSLNISLADEPLRFSVDLTNTDVESRIHAEAKKQPLGLMNKPAALLEVKQEKEVEVVEHVGKGPRVDDASEGGINAEFDPITVLTNVNKTKEVIKVSEPPVEDVLMARTLWPEQ